MTPASSVHKLFQRARNRIRRLDHIFALRHLSSERDKTLVVGGLVVELDNILIQTTRLYVQHFLSQLMSRRIIVIDSYPARLSSDEFSEIIVSKFDPGKWKAARTKRKRLQQRDEKVIRNPAEWMWFIESFGAQGPKSLNDALSLNYKFHEEIGIFRNFYAHRGISTITRIEEKYPQLKYGQVRHPDDIVTSAVLGAEMAKYLQWSMELKTFLFVAAGEHNRDDA